MALWRSMGARKDATRGTTALEVRRALSALISGPGVLPGGLTVLVTGTGSWAYAVGAANFASRRTSTDGLHVFGNDGTAYIGASGEGGTVPAAPSSGLQRWDIGWVMQTSASENGDTVSAPVFGVTSGVAASTATPPTIPTGALELFRNLMTSAASSTGSGGNTITQTAAVATLRGPGSWSSYSPEFSASGVAPSLGTGGTQQGFWSLNGKTMMGNVTLSWGASPSAGTGFYVVNMPAEVNLHGVALLRVGRFTLQRAAIGATVEGDLVMVNASQAKMVYSAGPGTLGPTVDGVTPQPWAPSDGDAAFIRFECEAV